MYRGGYTGRTAWVDLTNKKVEIQSTDTELARLFLGATGFGIKLLYDHVKPGTDPLVLTISWFSLQARSQAQTHPAAARWLPPDDRL